MWFKLDGAGAQTIDWHNHINDTLNEERVASLQQYSTEFINISCTGNANRNNGKYGNCNTLNPGGLSLKYTYLK